MKIIISILFSIVLLLSFSVQESTASKPSALFLYYTENTVNLAAINTLANNLYSTGNFSKVEVAFLGNRSIDVNFVTQYQSVLVYNFNPGASNNTQFGNLLDSVLKSGKTGIVLSATCIQTAGTFGGSWSDDDKVIGSSSENFASCSSMTILEPSSPIFNGVGKVFARRGTQSTFTYPGSKILAKCGTYPLVVTKIVDEKFRRIDLNLWLGSSNPGGDYVQLTANSLLWVAGKDNRCEGASSCRRCNVGQTGSDASCYWCFSTNTCLTKNSILNNECRSFSPIVSDCPPPVCSDYDDCSDCVKDSNCVYCVNTDKCIDFKGSGAVCDRVVGSEQFCKDTRSQIPL